MAKSTMETLFKEYIPEITGCIVREILTLINYNFVEHRDTFYTWFMTNSDYDFMYIYETNFKKFFLQYFTVETERVLSYYSQNLVYAVSSFYEMYRELTNIDTFIQIFITKQFEFMDYTQLYMEI
jgi:hypothetical protein